MCIGRGWVGCTHAHVGMYAVCACLQHHSVYCTCTINNQCTYTISHHTPLLPPPLTPPPTPHPTQPLPTHTHTHTCVELQSAAHQPTRNTHPPEPVCASAPHKTDLPAIQGCLSPHPGIWEGTAQVSTPHRLCRGQACCWWPPHPARLGHQGTPLLHHQRGK